MPGAPSRAVAATLTVLLHLALGWALVHESSTTNVPPPPPQLAFDEITAERLQAAQDHLVSVALVRSESMTSGLACAGSSYVGIGVTADPRTERIILVGDDTPAARAGLRRDDIVLNPHVWRGAHREGALLQLFVLRDRVKLAVVVRVGTICIG
jgi:hypothetical protein